MGKRIALTDYIEVDGQDLSSHCRSVAFTSEDERVDVSGFNASGSDEFLAGNRVREVTCEFFMNRESSSVHDTIYPLHRDREEFEFVWRADQNNPVSATNPELSGTVIVPSYGEGATRGEAEVASITFVSQGDNGLEFTDS